LTRDFAHPHLCLRCEDLLGAMPSAPLHRSFPQTGEFLKRMESLLAYLMPHYIEEGKAI